METNRITTRKYCFTFKSLNFEVTSFREMLELIHKTYYVALVRIDDNRNVYFADVYIGFVDCIPYDYKG